MTKFRYARRLRVPSCPKCLAALARMFLVAANYLGSFVAKSAKNFPA
jgi:hypothetical protein